MKYIVALISVVSIFLFVAFISSYTKASRENKRLQVANKRLEAERKLWHLVSYNGDSAIHYMYLAERANIDGDTVGRNRYGAIAGKYALKREELMGIYKKLYK